MWQKNLTLKTETVSSFEMSVYTYKTTRLARISTFSTLAHRQASVETSQYFKYILQLIILYRFIFNFFYITTNFIRMLNFRTMLTM